MLESAPGDKMIETMRNPLWKSCDILGVQRRKILDGAILLGVLFVAIVLTLGPSVAQNSRKTQQINTGTVGIISGGTGGTDLNTLRDLATVFDSGGSLRILPIIGRGSLQNIDDILYLKGIDVGIVQSDVLTYIKQLPGYDNIGNRINYITKLFDLEFHLIAGKQIASVADLAGKKVNFGRVTTGSHITASAIFSALGVNVTPVYHETALALEMVQDKKIAATVFVAGKPDDIVARLKSDRNLHLLPVDYAKPLRKTYLPAILTNADYPDFIPKGTSIRTISVGSVMAVYNWTPIRSLQRYQKVVFFIDAFIERYEQLQKAPRHPKWRDLNLAALVPGWNRFPPAKARIDNLRQRMRKKAQERRKTRRKTDGRIELNSFDTANKDLFFKFLQDRNVDAEVVSDKNRGKLFQEYLRWQNSRNVQ